MRAACAGLLIATLFSFALAASGGQELPPGLEAAQQALTHNLALGDSLAGGSATQDQAAEATRWVADGLAAAHAWLETQPRSAEAHHLIGLLLVLAYRPVESKATLTDRKTGTVTGKTLIVLRRGRKETLEEGVAELRAATRMAPANADYQMDYTEALLMQEQAKRAGDLLSALWQRKADLTAIQRARAARLAAQSARSQKQLGEEQRWLRELLANDPKDRDARRRLAELTPRTTGVAWEGYESGMGQGKPVMIDFMASWCGWCKKLDQEVYTKPDVIVLSRQFACIKVDGDQRSDLTRRYRVTGYPTIVFLDAQGREVNRVPGYVPATSFVAEMRKGLGSR